MRQTTDDPSLVSLVPGYPFSQQSWYKNALAARGNVIYINPHQQNYLQQPLAPRVFSVARLIKDPDTWHPLAIILADADTAILQQIVGGIQLNVRSTIAVFGTDKQPIYSNPPLSKEVLQEIAQKATSLHDAQDSYSESSHRWAKTRFGERMRSGRPTR